MASRRIRLVLRWAGLAIVVLLLAMQLFPVERTNPPVGLEVEAPTEIRSILRKACYDCHSHETHWPWYSYVAPVSWWIVDHVDDGRGDLNFSDWPAFDFEAQKLSFHDIEEQITTGEMPLTSYKLLHPPARLDASERRLLVDWARSNR